jgi:RND family efflux transporter MFP subunit
MIRLGLERLKTMPWLLGVVVLVAVVGLLAERTLARREGSLASGPEAESADLTGLDCLIQPAVLVELGSPVSGVIEGIHVDRGERVAEGQLLVELEAGVERATVELARARAAMESEIRANEAKLALDRRRVSRKDRMLEKRAVSIDDMDQAETEALLGELELQQAQENRQLARLELVRAQAALRRRAIYSPFSGVVVHRMMELGSRVSDQPVLKLAQLDPLRVELIAPAHLFGTIEKGSRAEVMTELPVGGRFEGTVASVDPIIDAASGRFGVEIELPNPDHEIPAGLRCQVQLLRD